MQGRIICINTSIHKVLLENNTIIDCKTRGKLRNMDIAPVVGDLVMVDTDKQVIEKVLKRTFFVLFIVRHRLFFVNLQPKWMYLTVIRLI